MSLLADVTAVMSEVGRERPDLVQDSNVSLFIDKVIERAKLRDHPRSDRAPDLDQN